MRGINCQGAKTKNKPSPDNRGRVLSNRKYSIGLGIDAGGTFTDTVLFDFEKRKVLFKAKALTTKWNYSEGIINAINLLPSGELQNVALVSLSTTLVTNAIVESNIYPVGLLLMPSGSFKIHVINHSPSKVIQGRMSIDGNVTEPVNSEEIKRIIEKMISIHKVQSFAVSSYGGTVNPELELEVKKIIHQETNMDVCCGHELSGVLNFYVRANTAVLNAGTIPIMKEFLLDIKTTLTNIGIRAPVMIVRGDGSVMSSSFAREFPVQTALSGPAASIAGARYLTEISDALVIDMGGTTTDIGFIEKDEVNICNDGAQIGLWKTHVKAVDMLTAGLGGDSEIIYNRSDWSIGPRRITPFCFMTTIYNPVKLLKSATTISNDSWESSEVFQWLYLSGKDPDFNLSIHEVKIMKALQNGPLMLPELSKAINSGDWKFIRTDRLEKTGCIIRSGLTPTDLFHAEGTLDLWNFSAAADYINFIARSTHISLEKLKKTLTKHISDLVGTVLLTRIFPEFSDHPELINQILNKGNKHLFLHSELRQPVIGLGASAKLMLIDTISNLEGNLILPEHGDVANAVGAITSQVAVTLKGSVVPTSQGLYRIISIKNNKKYFEKLEEAETVCKKELKESIRALARKAGTSEKEVSINTITRSALDVSGKEIFLEQIFTVSINGMPDLM